MKTELKVVAGVEVVEVVEVAEVHKWHVAWYTFPLPEAARCPNRIPEYCVASICVFSSSLDLPGGWGGGSRPSFCFCFFCSTRQVAFVASFGSFANCIWVKNLHMLDQKTWTGRSQHFFPRSLNSPKRTGTEGKATMVVVGDEEEVQPRDAVVLLEPLGLVDIAFKAKT